MGNIWEAICYIGGSTTPVRYYYRTNAQGDVKQIVDSNYNVVAYYAYDAWGKLLAVLDGNDNPITDSSHFAIVNPFRYRGYIYDTETGFYYVSSRFYDPEIGRWINADDAIAGVGVGAPGPIDAGGVVHRAVNLGWKTFNVKETLEALINLPVRAGNDANVAALGEMWMGGGKGYKDLVVVTLGTGVGGGIIVDGRMISGSTGAAGEIGHIHVDDTETDVCNCGNKGCLEQFASATGITRLANKKLASTDMDSVLRGGEVSAKTVLISILVCSKKLQLILKAYVTAKKN